MNSTRLMTRSSFLVSRSSFRSRSRLPAHVSLEQLGVLAVERHVAAGDHDVADARSNLERVPLDDQQVRKLAGLERAEGLVRAENLRGVDRERLDGFVTIETPGHRHRRLKRNQPDVAVAAARERAQDAGGRELAGR